MDHLHIVTVSTDSKYYFPYLIKSCKKNGGNLEVLGYGEKWEGFNWRYTKMIEYLKNINGSDIVCFIDGYDIVCTRNLNELSEVFIDIKERTKCKMIVGHEIQFFLNKIGGYYFNYCKNESLNAGTYIAYAKDMLEIIQHIYDLNPRNDADDQVLMTQYCRNASSDEIYIDTHNEMFLTISNSLYDIGNRVEYTKENHLIYKNNRPFFVHAPGFGYLDSIVVNLGYAPSCNIKNELFYNFFREKMLLYLKNIFSFYFLAVFLIAGLVLYILYFIFFTKFTKGGKGFKNKWLYIL